MKKQIKALVITLVAILVGVGGVSAAPYQSIDTSACESVYTNYYFFLDALTKDYFSNGLSNTTHRTVAEYTNNSYLSDFDMNNIGTGQVNVAVNTYTSADGLTSMSLNDYYTHYLKAANSANGKYTSGNNNYILHQNWYTIDANGNTIYKTQGLDLATYSKDVLINASLVANSKFTPRSTFSYNRPNPMQIQIDRSYYGYFTTPLSYKDKQYYLHPAIYYVQYCSPKKAEVKKYNVRYHANASNVSNMPNDETENVGKCIRIGNAPSREGYRFVGWSKKSYAADMAFMPRDSYCGKAGDLDLYAIWEEIIPQDTYYTITYMANGSNVTDLPDQLKQNTKYDAYISSAEPKRPGYTFLGWSPDSSDTTGNPNYAPGSTYKDRKDLILYAIWKQDVKDPDPVLPDNPKTGITDYLLPFGGVISASGLGLGVLKKKKNFKQF